MRDGLEGADRRVELLALFGVLDRHLLCALRNPDHLGRERNFGAGQRAGYVTGEWFAAARAHAGVTASWIDRCERLNLRIATSNQSCLLALDQNDYCCAVGVGHNLSGSAVGEGNGRRRLTGSDPRKPLGTLLVAAGVLNHQTAERVG